MKSLHVMFGLCVFVLVLFRLLVKRLSPRPEEVETQGLWLLLHRAAGNIGYGLIWLHVAASLFHQMFLKDRLLKGIRWL
jgi:cytochrome b561